MYKRFLPIVVCVFVMFFTANNVYAIPADNGRMVRVGISDIKFKNYYYNTINITATDVFKVVDKSTNALIAQFSPNEDVNISIKNNQFVISRNNSVFADSFNGPIVVESDNGFVGVSKMTRAGKPAIYRGIFEIAKAPNKDNQFNLINVLDLQSYLRGVVPNEMPVRFGIEALKAQAVLARNYAIKPRENNQHNYDVCDSVACQVYFGANTEKELSDQAVYETENIVAMHEGQLVLALYSSTAGGHTENYEYAFSTNSVNGKMFPGTPLPYLAGVPDDKSTADLSKEENARKFYTSTPQTFDNASPYFRWTKEWNRQELEDILKKTLKTQASTGFVFPKNFTAENFGTIKDIKVLRRGVSGKAMSIDIITDKGTINVQKELPIRRTFQKNNVSLPSANVVFDVVTEETPITQSNGGVKKINTVTKIIAYGGGFGHGVGMSQYGAGSMGEKGCTYDEIIQHYFTKTAITTYPVELSNQTGHDTETQMFYTESKKEKAYLVIENKFQFSKLTVVLNGQELALELVPRMFKPDKFDISKYIKKGENNITYILPYSDSHKKPVRMYVEIKEAQDE